MSADGLTGRGVERNDIWPLLNGEAQFVADLPRDGGLHAAFVRSSQASARLSRVDTITAGAMPGVVHVLTGPELARNVRPIRPPVNSVTQHRFAEFFGVRSFPRQIPPLAVDEVRYVGEPIAVVVATDRYRAEDAAQQVVVEYTERPASVDLAHALDPGAPVVHSDLVDNVAVQLNLTKGTIPTSSADLITVESTYRIGRQTGFPMECRGVFAYVEPDGSLAVWSSTQVPFIVHQLLCAATGWDPRSVRVRSPAVGGGFGMKASVYAEEVVVPWLARSLGRPVVWVEDRYENLIGATQARDNLHRTRLTVDRSGSLVAWEDDYLVDLGVHNFWMVGVVANTAVHLLGAYRIPNVSIRGTGVFSNKTPTAQYRGAGRPEASFVLERSIDKAARAIGIAPAKLRQMNILGPADLPYPQHVPYRDGVDIVYDGADYSRVLRAALDLVPEEEIAALKVECDADQRVGVGIGVYMEATARGPSEPETARARLRTDGTWEVATGTSPSGQAHSTVFAQVAADVASVPMQQVVVITGDTGRVSQGLGSFASRSAVVAGSAVRLAMSKAVDAACQAAREVFADDAAAPAWAGITVPTLGRTVSYQELAELLAQRRTFVAGEAPQVVVDETHTFAPDTVTWTMGVHVAVASVDVETGKVTVLRYGVAHEAGPSLNPRIVDGQIRGGVAQGIGGALLEEVRHDGAGQNISATLADYLVPTAADVPEVRLAHFEVPSALNPLGIRGVGESGIIASNAALAGAVDDALEEFGVHVNQTPMTAGYVRRLIGTGPQ